MKNKKNENKKEEKKFFNELSSSNVFNHEVPIDEIASIKLTDSQLNQYINERNINMDFYLLNNQNKNEEIGTISENIIDSEEEEVGENEDSNYYSQINDKILISSTFDKRIGSKIKNGTITIIKEIDSGGQATVYLGLNEENKKNVAVKFYNIEREELLNKVTRQFDFLEKLHNENIVNYLYYEFQKPNNNFIQTNITIIMEYYDTNLEKYINQYKQENKLKYIPLKMIGDITKQILNGLYYLHKNKIIHRDIKPRNILLNYNDKIMKICDFGISLLIKNDESTMIKRSMVGEINYMSPEALMEKNTGFDSDIWSLGCVVYFLVSGLHPYTFKDKNKPNFNIFQIMSFSNPLEVADDDILDFFYHRDNRILLDFVHKCWRGNNIYRPTAQELLKHPFVNGYYDDK